MIKGPLARLIAAERRRQRASLLRASVCAVGCAAAAVALLGLSGQFITAAALAGAAGTALAFNYLLPAAAIRGLAILRTGCRYGERLESHRAALGALARIRSALFAALAAAPPEQALSLAAGEACARLVQDVGTVETLFVRQSSRWAAGAALIAGVSLAGLAGWRCAAATVGLFLVSQAAAWGIGRSAWASGAAVQTAVGRLKDSAFALLSAAPELVAYALQDWASVRLATDSDALAAAHRRLAMLEGAQGALFAAMGALTAVCVLALAHPAPLPRAALAALGALATVEVGAGLVRGRLRDGAMGEAARRLDPILAFAPERRIDAAPACVALTLRWPLRGRVALAPGERMGVTGRSGAGKTTLLEKLVKLRDCDRGELTLGGADLAGLTPETARGAFAYAPQSALLLSGTVAQTLRLGAPDVDEDALWAALFDAGLDLRVQALPGGLQAQIGEGGERLSGGERRRLCLARALLKQAPWLLLDEPTEGLDPQTEALVVERLRRRLDRTRQGLILVSHRPAPLSLCTRTLALDDAVCAPPQARLVQRPNSQWTRNRGKPAVAIRDRVTPPSTHSRAREWP